MTNSGILLLALTLACQGCEPLPPPSDPLPPWQRKIIDDLNQCAVTPGCVIETMPRCQWRGGAWVCA